LRCKRRNFELSNGAMIFLHDASMPMIEFLQKAYINDTEAIFGDTDILMKIRTTLTSPKKALQVSFKTKRPKKQLYYRLRPPYSNE